MSTLKIQTPRIFAPLLQPSRYKAVYGGRGCVHPDTLIDTPTGRVKIKDFHGGQVFSYFKGLIVTGIATKPKRYPAEQLYKVRFKDGREIIVTDEHKFLTDSGYRQLNQISISSGCVCVPCRGLSSLPRSILGIYLSGSREGARRYFGRVIDYLGGCLTGHRLCDEQLLQGARSGQAFSPLPDGVQLHTRRVLTYGDGQRLSGKGSLLRTLSRLSNFDAPLLRGGKSYKDLGSYNAGIPSERVLGSTQVFQQSLVRNTHLLLRKVSGIFVLGYGIFLGLAQTLRRVFDNLFVGAGDNPSLILNEIISVCKHSHQPYYDLHVHKYENYLSNGIINHNSGKSHTLAELAIERCLSVPGTRIVCIREVQKSLRDSVKLLLEDKIKAFGVSGQFRIMNDAIIAPGGGIIVFNGMADHTADSIKSLEGFDIAYVEEAHTLTERSLELLRPTIRKTGSELWFSWNPRNANDPVDYFFRNEPPPNSIIINANYMDNPWFPEELELERAFDEKTNPARYEHVWLGGYEPQAVGAIWTRDVIQRNRRKEAPKLNRILVAVDPPISSEKGSDEAGIIVGGLGNDKRGYVIADVSTQGTPKQWAEKVIAAYDLYEADAIVAEVNQGGEMVENTIHSVRLGVRVISVRATRGKHVRAEPISALYSLDRISHIGDYPKLEMQMCLCTADGYMGDGSPDRMDSMVWLFTELFPRMVKRDRPRGGMRPVVVNNRYSPLGHGSH